MQNCHLIQLGTGGLRQHFFTIHSDFFTISAGVEARRISRAGKACERQGSADRQVLTVGAGLPPSTFAKQILHISKRYFICRRQTSLASIASDLIQIGCGCPPSTRFRRNRTSLSHREKYHTPKAYITRAKHEYH